MKISFQKYTSEISIFKFINSHIQKKKQEPEKFWLNCVVLRKITLKPPLYVNIFKITQGI